MITIKNKESIQQAANMYRKSPNEKAWLRLEKMLVENKAEIKIKWYKTALAASVTLLIICTIFLYKHNQSLNNVNGLAEETSDYKTVELQSAKSEYEIFYAPDKIAELQRAYIKLGYNKKG